MKSIFLGTLFLIGTTNFSFAQNTVTKTISSSSSNIKGCGVCSFMSVHFNNLTMVGNRGNFKNGNGFDIDFM